MATVSFAPKPASEKPATPAPATEVASVAVVPTAAQPLATPTPQNASGIEGEVNTSNIRPPRLNLVQKSGNLSNDFPMGCFTYDKTFALNEMGKSDVKVTVLRFKKYYQEKLEYGGDTLPLRFDTAAEVRANGGTTQFGQPGFYDEAADLLLAIEAPDNLDEDQMMYFPYEHDGKAYGMALWTISAGGFRSVGVRIISDATMLLKDGLWTGQYSLTSEMKKSPKNSWFVPIAKFEHKHTPEASEFFRGMSGR